MSKLKGHKGSVLTCCLHGCDQQVLLSGGEDGMLCLFDLRTEELQRRIKLSGLGAVPSVLCHPSQPSTVYAAVGCGISEVDLRQEGSAALVCHTQLGQEELNCLALNPSGSLLAAADDGGTVHLLELPSWQARPALQGGHTSICSSVAFSPQHPSQVLSGGLDSLALQWDVEAGQVLARHSTAANKSSTGNQLCNPPMVHSLAVLAAVQGSHAEAVALARGDGCVAVHKLTSKGGSSAASKSKLRHAKGKASGQHRQWQELCLLGPDHGGHSAAVNSVEGVAADGSPSLLLSGGNDRQVMLWDWQTTQPQPPSSFQKMSLEDVQRPLMARQWRLGRKVNCAILAGGKLVVADTSHFISVQNAGLAA